MSANESDYGHCERASCLEPEQAAGTLHMSFSVSLTLSVYMCTWAHVCDYVQTADLEQHRAWGTDPPLG